MRAETAQSHRAILSPQSHARKYSVSLPSSCVILSLSLSPLLTHTLFLTHARNPLRDRRNPPPPSASKDAANVEANNDFKMRRDALDSPTNPSINSGIWLKRTKTKQLTHGEVEGKKSCLVQEQNPLGRLRERGVDGCRGRDKGVCVRVRVNRIFPEGSCPVHSVGFVLSFSPSTHRASMQTRVRRIGGGGG